MILPTFTSSVTRICVLHSGHTDIPKTPSTAERGPLPWLIRQTTSRYQPAHKFQAAKFYQYLQLLSFKIISTKLTQVLYLRRRKSGLEQTLTALLDSLAVHKCTSLLTARWL